MTLHINFYSSVGLILDLIGVLYLFKFGLPSEISEGSVLIDNDKPDENKNKHIRRMAHLGLIFIFLGFVFQLVGSNLTFR